MSQRNYNQIYTFGPLILQITQDGQHDGIVIDLLPALTLVINGPKLAFGFGLSWICGSINFGVMCPYFNQQEKKRIEDVKKLAAKDGLTPRQYLLRWGW